MKRWWLVILLLLSVGVNAGLLAQRGRAEEKRERREAGRRGDRDARGDKGEQARPPRLTRLLDRMVEQVGVEGEQRQKFVALHESFFERTLATRERLRQSQKALRDNLASPAPDRALADSQAAEIAAAQKEIEAAFIDNFFAAGALLDEGQKARYSHLVAELHRLRWNRGRRDRTTESGESRRSRREEAPEKLESDGR